MGSGVSLHSLECRSTVRSLVFLCREGVLFADVAHCLISSIFSVASRSCNVGSVAVCYS